MLIHEPLRVLKDAQGVLNPAIIGVEVTKKDPRQPCPQVFHFFPSQAPRRSSPPVMGSAAVLVGRDVGGCHLPRMNMNGQPHCSFGSPLDCVWHARG
jgi:hypothetical protein